MLKKLVECSAVNFDIENERERFFVEFYEKIQPLILPRALARIRIFFY